MGLKIASFHFSEALDGKGPCDRKAGSIKDHVLLHVSEGHNVSNVAELKAAIESNGVRNCRVYLYKAPINGRLVKGKLCNITSFHDFTFADESLTAWKVYGVGVGKCLSWKDFGPKTPTQWHPPTITILEAPTVINEEEPSHREMPTATAPSDLPCHQDSTKDG